MMDLESCLSRGDREASRGRISKKESETDKVLPTFFTKHIDVRLWINQYRQIIFLKGIINLRVKTVENKSLRINWENEYRKLSQQQ